MSLVDWRSLPVRVKRSRKRLYGVLADEYNLVTWMELPNEVKRSKKKLYDFIANELNISSFEELPIECRRSTRLMYTFIQENGGGGSTDTLTVSVTDESSVAISGASVVIGETSKSTGDDGKATFQLAYGDYEATVSAEGYATVTEELAFRSNHKNFEIELEAETPVVTTGTVTVTCQDSSEQAVEGAFVELATDLSDITTLVGVGITASNGTVTLKTINTNRNVPMPTETVADIPFGTYILYAEDSEVTIAYENASFVVDGDETVTITLTQK